MKYIQVIKSKDEKRKREKKSGRGIKPVCRLWAPYSSILYSWLPGGPKGTAEPCSGSAIVWDKWINSDLILLDEGVDERQVVQRWEDLLVRSIWVRVCVCGFHKRGVIVNSFACVTFSSRQCRLEWRKAHKRKPEILLCSLMGVEDLVDQAGIVDFHYTISRV